MKKFVVVLITFFLCLNNINALELPIKSEHAVLYNVNEDKIVYRKNSNLNTSIASITKVMTILVTLDNEKDLNKKVILKPIIFKGLKENNLSTAGFKEGETVTVKDLVYGAMLPSGADATTALAYHVAGSEENFVKLMNKKASSIGMKNTVFTNASGMDKEGQKSTVEDILEMIKYGLRNPEFKKIFSTKRYTTTNNLKLKSTILKSDNKYKIGVEYIKGGKTGYTENAQLSLASYTKYNDISYILVTTKSPDVDNKYPFHLKDAKTIYEYFFNNYGYVSLYKPGDKLLSIPAKNSKVNSVDYFVDSEIKVYLPLKYDDSLITYKYTGKDLSYKNKKGENIGTYQVFYDKELIKEIKLKLPEKIKPSLKFVLLDNKVPIIIEFLLVLSLCLLFKYSRKHSKKLIKK